MRVGEPPSRRGTTPEMVLALGTTRRTLLKGRTLQPLREGPLLAFLGGRAPEGLSQVLAALFPADGPRSE